MYQDADSPLEQISAELSHNTITEMLREAEEMGATRREINEILENAGINLNAASEATTL